MAVYLIRLEDGTEVVTEVIGFDTENGLVKCSDPLQINYRMSHSQAAPSMSMSRFMPFAKEPMFEFKMENIIQITETRDSVAEYYHSILSDYIIALDERIDAEMGRSSKREDQITEADMYTDLLEKVEPNGGPLH